MPTFIKPVASGLRYWMPPATDVVPALKSNSKVWAIHRLLKLSHMANVKMIFRIMFLSLFCLIFL